jgi:transcriptional antiterminator RfaH
VLTTARCGYVSTSYEALKKHTPMNNFSSAWYVIYTRPRHEKRVVEHLAQLNIETFLPCIVTLRKWHDRKKYLEVPLFPSYVFVYLKTAQEYFDSLNGKKIAHIFRF